MADEETKENANEEEESPMGEQAAPAKKGSKLPLIIGAVVVIALLGGGGFFFYSNYYSAEAAEGEEIEEQEEITQTNIYFDGFATNIANLEVSDDYEYLYIKYGFDVEVSSNSVVTEIVAELPRLTAIASEVMSNRNYTEICSPQGRERVAREVMRAMNDELDTGQIIGVYFHTFVAQ